MIDETIRSAAFLYLKNLCDTYAYVVPYEELKRGIEVNGSTIHLVGPSGIWKPKACELPLSITSTFNGPYPDAITDDLLVYRYRVGGAAHRDNVGLREAFRTRTPLIYFHGVAVGKYVPVWPIFIVENRPQESSVLAAIDPAYISGGDISIPGLLDHPSETGPETNIRRYVATLTRQRLHQTQFREMVISAYSHTCVFCRLRHAELLDAAHIIPDSQPGGEPIVPNGLCLCKIHHAAYDQNLIGISPDYVAHVQPRILEESDGPMLRHGIQGMDGATIVLPRSRAHRPDPERLDRRYQQFLDVG